MDRKKIILIPTFKILSLKEVSLSKRPNDYKISQNRILIFYITFFRTYFIVYRIFRVNKFFPLSERVKV